MIAVVQALSFGLEMAALFLLARWGWRLDAALWLRVLAAIILPTLAATCWGIWAAPRSSFRLPDPARLAFETLFFGMIGLALLNQDANTTALIFGALVLLMWAASSALGLRKWDAS
ncbi:YrdB family protein [Deinococcus sp.]|uniref:YrdB family protein n=1 Tax=Deinococcus sp. TaxID=47478 RepID=UPI003B5BFE4E